MSEKVSAQLDSYYTTNVKAQRPSRPVAKAPDALPGFHVYSDRDANNKLRAINQDIYIERKKEEAAPFKKFIKVAGLSILGILAIFGLKKLFKKS